MEKNYSADSKSDVVSLVKPVQKSRCVGGYLEISNITKIPHGVQMYVRSWDKNNNAIGFGSDGSVEIEKIRIFNPPLLVPDDNGNDLIRTDVTDDGTVYEQRYRLDPEEALRQAVENALNAKIDKRIGKVVSGKVGRTTDVYYSSSGDGWVQNVDSTVWSTARSDNTGSSADTAGTTARIQSGLSVSSNYQIRRAFVPFDTSALPDSATISSATIQLYVTTKVNGDNDGDDWIVVVGPTTRPSTSAIVNSDFAKTSSLDSATEGSDRKDITGLTTSAYNTWTLDSDGIGWISKTGVSDFGFREGHDVINSAYAGAANNRDEIRFSTSEQAGTTQDPTLTITYTTSAIKTLNGLVIASVKAVKGLAIASVKTVNGLTNV